VTKPPPSNSEIPTAKHGKRAVRKNKYGYYEIVNKPTHQELQDYYEHEYHKIRVDGLRTTNIAPIDKDYININLELKYSVINELHKKRKESKLLDVGCGEGWCLSYFNERGWDVTGLDLSDFGCQIHHPHLLSRLISGDISTSIKSLHDTERTFDLIFLDNVLEHVISPEELINDCRQLAHQETVLLIEVPNDYSPVQNHLMKESKISEDNFVVYPDHLSYFNAAGLSKLLEACGWKTVFTMSDFPIDLFLFNETTNYYHNPSIGRTVHEARVEIVKLLHSISITKSIDLYRSFAELGLGRQLISYYQLI
jgi:2-polyprenyl-3-methyl-5-hydroxy-6-metoxy-1,4-benzoquinol methylase